MCIILILLLILVMSGCSDKKNIIEDEVSTSENDNYDIVKATYADKDININYPQISNLSDSDKQERINKLIKTQALEVLEDYKDGISNLKFSMDFEIMYKGADLLSIQYLGLSATKGAAFPINEFNTTNIDLAKEQLLTLTDVVTVNDSFIEKFNSGKYKAYGSDLNLESEGALSDALTNFDDNDLIESLKQQTSKFYFAKDSLVVSAEVAHVMGDHMEMEIKYDDLGDLLLLIPAQ